MDIEAEVDARGLNCPLPILRAKKALAALESGQLLRVLTTDAHAREDFAAFTAQTGHTLVEQREEEDGVTLHVLRRR